MKPANTGTISAKAEPPPICISAAANVSLTSNALMPNTNDSAMHRPPATTIGSM